MNDTCANTVTPRDPSDTTILSLIHAAHALEDKLEETFKRVGLSTPKYSVLNELVSADAPLPLCELAARVSCVRSNMTQLVDRLEADQLVKRVDDPSDRRSVKAEVTDEGRRRHSAAAAELARLHEEFAANVATEDRAALGRLLTALK